MNNALKGKLFIVGLFLFCIFFYIGVFGANNMVIGMFIAMAALMNLGNDFTYKPKLSFFKVLLLLLILGIVAFLNNPISIFGCILTFFVVFGVTITSYHLFATSVYLPYLMLYFMMMSCLPVSFEELPMRLLSLVVGAIFIVGINLIVNRNKKFKLSKQTIDSLVLELNNAVDLKLAGDEVSKENFKTANGFYLNMFYHFEYKFFPSPVQRSVLNIVKSFQHIGAIVADYDLSVNELDGIKKILYNLKDIKSLEFFESIDVDTKEMNIVLLNFEYIVDELNNVDSTREFILPDKKYIRSLIKPVIKRSFSFRSVKFAFAFKMAIILTLWEILTLLFNLPLTKWLYFATIPMMAPYINDLADSAKKRLKGTVGGALIFILIIIAAPYLPLSSDILMLVVMIVCMAVIVYNLKNTLIVTTVTTVMSVMAVLSYVAPDIAIELKVLWVLIGAAVAIALNYIFLPYSVEKESENNLKARYKFNGESINMIKEECNEKISSKKTSLLVMSDICGENIEITDENKSLFELQVKITDISNFILTYICKYDLSDDFKNNMVDIIDNGADVNDDLENKEKIILHSLGYLMDLFKEESKYFN
ncbi:MAG: FUSC family protein [Methanobrevibacter sp.]|uniref:FUSC family protein n=1 Tax=Methanobrevibacter sp. TaxID=66852 RepID=UPI0025FE75B2|nr:FUSC family protein [Methanobrevibacter sp.]MBQ6098668.1 FUSC family protein [Methanobrevibacter sp.]